MPLPWCRSPTDAVFWNTKCTWYVFRPISPLPNNSMAIREQCSSSQLCSVHVVEQRAWGRTAIFPLLVSAESSLHVLPLRKHFLRHLLVGRDTGDVRYSWKSGTEKALHQRAFRFSCLGNLLRCTSIQIYLTVCLEWLQGTERVSVWNAGLMHTPDELLSELTSPSQDYTILIPPLSDLQRLDAALLSGHVQREQVMGSLMKHIVRGRLQLSDFISLPPEGKYAP